MKKQIAVMGMGMVLVLSSCGTYTGAGAYTGGQFGYMIGSAVGGIAGGWRGSDVGAIVGTVGGAVAGAAIGAAADNAQQKRVEEYVQRRSQGQGYDDRITFDGDRTQPVSTNRHMVAAGASLELRNPRIVDANRDGVLTRGERMTVQFEIVNNSAQTVYDVYPMVEDVTGNKHVHVSQNLRIESIAPQQGVRYTATIQADRSLKDGEIVVRVGVAQGQYEIGSQTRDLRVTTRKR